MKRYFAWKDANCNGKNIEWIELSGSEFYALKKKNPSRRFITSCDEDNPDGDCFFYEATIENYNEWNKEQMREARRIEYLEKNYTVVSFDDLVSADDEEGLTWAEVIPDTRDEEEELERLEEERRFVLVSQMMAEIEKLPEDDKKLIYAVFLNPNGNMSIYEYADSIGISHQSVNKRKLKIFKKIRAAMGAKK